MKREKNSLIHIFIAMGSIAFFVAGVPVLDSIGSWLSNIFNLKSLKINNEAAKYTEPINDENTHAIGFALPNFENEEEYEDE